MTAANFNAASGEIVGKIAFLSPQLAYSFLRVDYGGGSQPCCGAYFVPLAAINALAAAQWGVSPSQFNAMPSSLRKFMQDKVRSKYMISGGWGVSKITYAVFTNYTQSSSFRSTLDSQKKGSAGLTYQDVHANAELVVGLIPEYGNGTATSSQLNSLNTAVKKMASWSKNQTIETAKAIRREKGTSIQTVFNGMIKWRDAGLGQVATVRKLI